MWSVGQIKWTMKQLCIMKVIVVAEVVTEVSAYHI